MVESENDMEYIKLKHGVSLLTSVYSVLTAAGIIMDCHISPPGGVLVLIYTSTKCHCSPIFRVQQQKQEEWEERS
jgi:hypothetical protein